LVALYSVYVHTISFLTPVVEVALTVLVEKLHRVYSIYTTFSFITENLSLWLTGHHSTSTSIHPLNIEGRQRALQIIEKWKIPTINVILTGEEHKWEYFLAMKVDVVFYFRILTSYTVKKSVA
jgi:hypothetical protein